MLSHCSKIPLRVRVAQRCAQKSLARLQSTSTSTPAYPEHYSIPQIHTINKFQSTGIPGLLSAKGLDNAYFSRVSQHVDRLNQELTRLSLNGNAALDVLVEQSASNARHVKVFQNASLIQNIAFAMSSIGEVREENSSQGVFKPDQNAFLKTPDLSLDIPNLPTETQKDLLERLSRDFGSLIEFKTLLINSANAINGDGFTWLVARDNSYFKEEATVSNAKITCDNLFVLNTYNSGSPKNRDRVGQLDILQRKYNNKNKVDEPLATSTTAIPDFEDAEFLMFQNIRYYPLLAIDTSPKVWLHDYGVFGKRQYLEQAWKSIDWDIVARRLPVDSAKVL